MCLIPLIPTTITPPDKVKDGCNAVSCPVAAGDFFHLLATVHVTLKPLLWNIVAPLELSLTNEKGQRIMCVQTTVDVHRGTENGKINHLYWKKKKQSSDSLSEVGGGKLSHKFTISI